MGGYVGGLMIEAALKGTGGRVDDKEALQKAMRAFALEESPRGPFHIDHLGNIVGNVFIVETQRQGGQLVNRIIKTYPDVSQFWTYDEKAFLAAPVYSRNDPPAKNLE
jgi:branched-chain amino acid transport system substrate-binding protein